MLGSCRTNFFGAQIIFTDLNLIKEEFFALNLFEMKMHSIYSNLSVNSVIVHCLNCLFYTLDQNYLTDFLL